MIKVECFSCNMLAENCFVVSDETKECVIIDCGAYRSEERNKIIKYIQEEKLKPVHLLSTHGHLDHHLGDNTIFETYGLKPEAHEGDRTWMENPQNAASTIFGITLNYNLPETNYCIKNNTIIKFGTHSLKTIATPGHSNGSVCYYCEKEHLLFTGDTLFKRSIGRTDFPGGSMFQMVSSLRLLAQLPDETIIYPGHGDSSTIGYEVAHNLYLDR